MLIATHELTTILREILLKFPLRTEGDITTLLFAVTRRAACRRVNLHAVDALQSAHQRAAATALAHHLLQLFRTKLDFALADVNGQRALRRQQEEVRQAIFAFRGLRRRDVDDLVALAF